jgi:arylsulfatase A-like enzyme
MCALALLAGLAAVIGCSRPEPRWNVLVLVPDTVRADHLSLNGYARQTTPYLEKLARESTNFTQAITVAPRTWQAFSSILTGVYPPRHGVRFIFDHPIRAEVSNLAEILKAAGYETRAFEADPLRFLRRMTGGRGFDRYVDPVFTDPYNSDAIVVESIEKYVLTQAHEPFLAFARLEGAHWPYWDGSWAHEYDDCPDCSHAFNVGRYGVWENNNHIGMRLYNPAAQRSVIFPDPPDEAVRRHMIAHYDSEVRFFDQLAETLIEQMREKGVLERTIVVIASDHGESFGEHGYMQHGPRVDEPVMRVPLLIRLPQGHHARRDGVVVGQLVRVIDILPTILDALGMPIPPGLDGVSLLPAIQGGQLPDLWAYGETGASYMEVDPDLHYPGVRGKHRMIRTHDRKLILVPRPEGDRRSLYDLEHDPGESDDIAADHADEVRRFGSLLAGVMAPDEKPKLERKLTDAERKALRSLGYAD